MRKLVFTLLLVCSVNPATAGDRPVLNVEQARTEWLECRREQFVGDDGLPDPVYNLSYQTTPDNACASSRTALNRSYFEKAQENLRYLEQVAIAEPAEQARKEEADRRNAEANRIRKAFEEKMRAHCKRYGCKFL